MELENQLQTQIFADMLSLPDEVFSDVLQENDDALRAFDAVLYEFPHQSVTKKTNSLLENHFKIVIRILNSVSFLSDKSAKL